MAKQSNIDAIVPKARSRKKVVAKQRRNSRVYKRIADLSVPFCEKGAATEHMIKDRSKNGLFDCSVVCCDVVEMTGVEPVSENIFTPASTSVDCELRFPLHTAHNQAICYGSFVNRDCPQSKGQFMGTTMVDASGPCRGQQRLRRLRKIRQRKLNYC